MSLPSENDSIVGSIFGTTILVVVLLAVVGGVICLCGAFMLGAPDDHDRNEHHADEHGPDGYDPANTTTK
jgi:hypothetical protein